jgi:hypothetical protein
VNYGTVEFFPLCYAGLAAVMVITALKGETMMRSIKTLVVVALLVAASSTAFAQRAPSYQAQSPTTETYSGAYSNMNRPE